MIDIDDYPFKHNSRVEFCNNIVKNRDSQFKLTVFRGKNAEVKNCSISGLLSPIRAQKFSNCKFENCSSVISNCRGTTLEIDTCVFINCTAVITDAPKGTKIKYCQFISCYDLIISSSWYGGINISFCQFFNIKNKGERGLGSDLGWNASIKFDHSGKESSRSDLTNCTFDGAVLNDAFLISAPIHEDSLAVCIGNCDFKNCSTDRKSGCIIKTRIKYDKVFKKDIEAVVVRVSDCRGLDNVNKESNEAPVVVVREDVGATVQQEDVGASKLLEYAISRR